MEFVLYLFVKQGASQRSQSDQEENDMSDTTVAPDAPVAETETPKVGAWAELPPPSKKNGPASRFAGELNAAAREAEENPGKARVISVQKTVRSASGRASTIKRKLKAGPVNGLDFPAECFQIVPRGNVVYAVYTPKGDTATNAASDSTESKAATPDPKPAGRRRR